MIEHISEQECFELLSAETVGRVGVVLDGRVRVIPVNYLLDGHDPVIRTSSDGVLALVASGEDPTAEIAFEVDHHDGTSGYGWSVLGNGRLAVMAAKEVAAVPGIDRVVPWAGADRQLPLRFVFRAVSGRRVRRVRGPSGR